MQVIECQSLDEPHEHGFPDDWKFGGADGMDWRRDERWKPTTYRYYDAELTIVHDTQVPLCEREALDYFSRVASWGNLEPVYISVRHSGDRDFKGLPWQYNHSTDEIYPIGKGK